MRGLALNVGRRTSLLRIFRTELYARGGKLYASDIDGLAPALAEADVALRSPRVADPAYLDFIRDTVVHESIDFVFSCIDTDLLMLSEADLGACVLGSTPGLNRIALDKWSTYEFFSAQGVQTPVSWMPGCALNELPQDLFVKPRNGSASQNAKPASRDDLDNALIGVPNPIIQERLIGRELTIDALFDFEGRLLHYVPRQRIRHLAGESIQGVTVDDADFGPWLRRTLDAIGRGGGRGPITLQAFLTERGPVATEINPRFAGGFPLSHEAGSHQPRWCLNLVAGEPVDAQLGEYERGLYMTRTYQERFVRTLLWELA